MVRLLYLAIGIGLAGGWRHWTWRGRTLYVLAFPLHALLASLAYDLWPKSDRAKACWRLVFQVLAALFFFAAIGGR